MLSFTRLIRHSASHPGKTRRIVALQAVLVFLVLAGSSVGAAGQGLGSPQDSLQQNAPPNPQSRFPQTTTHDLKRPTEKQKQALVDYNFKKLKKHAADLAELAQTLQKDIEKSNANVLSLEIMKKANEVEKLAKKVKNEVRGYQ